MLWEPHIRNLGFEGTKQKNHTELKTENREKQRLTETHTERNERHTDETIKLGDRETGRERACPKYVQGVASEEDSSRGFGPGGQLVAAMRLPAWVTGRLLCHQTTGKG